MARPRPARSRPPADGSIGLGPIDVALAEGRPAYGCWISLGAPGVVEILGNSGFDWLLLDQQHSAVGPEALLELIRATNLTPASPIVRVPRNEPTLIEQALDSGAHGVMIPLVANRGEAERAVASVRYPPNGLRSIGGYRAQFSFGITRQAYLRAASAKLHVWAQIENQAGLESADQIAGVEGITGLFVGPQDLAASLGLRPEVEPDSVEFDDALKHLLEVSRRRRCPLGLLVSTRENTRRRSAEGFRLIAAAGDAGLLGQAAATTIGGL